MKPVETKIIHIDPTDPDDKLLEPAARALRDGKLVAFPTETVYGLGANALDDKAVASIFKAKGRPADNPLIVHVASVEDIVPLTRELPAVAKRLFEKFSPGPLTLILKRSDAVPDLVTAGLDTVAVRIPSHPVARRLIELANVPVAAPSANRSGRPSPTRGWHVEHDLAGRIPYIVEAGDCEFGLESTVVDVTGEQPVVLRPGALSHEAILAVTGQVSGHHRLTLIGEDAPRSPGMKYRHYAPAASVMIANGESVEARAKYATALIRKAVVSDRTVGLIGLDDFLQRIELDLIGQNLSGRDGRQSLPAISLGQTENSAAAGLFDALRRLDMTGVSTLIVEGLPEAGIGTAYMNRLRKAAAADEAIGPEEES